MRKTPLDKHRKPDIILRATGYGLRATGYGLRATGYGRLIANVNSARGAADISDMKNFFGGFPLWESAEFFWRAKIFLKGDIK